MPTVYRALIRECTRVSCLVDIDNDLARIRTCLAAALLILAGPGLAHAMVQQQSGADNAIPGQLLVRFTMAELSVAGGRTGIDAFDSRATKYSVTAIEKAFPSLDVIAARRSLSPAAEALRHVYVVQYASQHSPVLVAQDLAVAPEVIYAEPVFQQNLYGEVPDDGGGWRIEPDDPLYTSQTHLGRMQLPAAWDVVKGEDGTAVIAVVDGGTDWRHPDLNANVWTNPNEIDDNGIDDDNNGFIDDIHGWNFNQNKADPTGPFLSVTGRHGTHVAGAAAAVTNNSEGIAGSSWNAQFMAINTSCANQLLLCHTIRGIVYASMNGADVITASYGSHMYSQTDELAMQAALDQGALVVAASGNRRVNVDVQPFYPSAHQTTLSVGGIGKNSDVNQFNYGHSVNVFAPSRIIETTSPPNLYRIVQGTSFAVPLVAGVAALVKTAFPSFTPEQVREQIRLTAVSIDAANPQLAGNLGRGKVDAYSAVTKDPSPSLRVEAWTYRNHRGGDYLLPGDRVRVAVTFVNFHGDGQSVDAELTAAATYLQWDKQLVSLGSMAYGERRDATFTFTIASDAPYNRTLRLVPQITAGSFVDRTDVLEVFINEVRLRLPGAVSDQTYMVGTAIADLVLPEATGGTVPYSYTLTPDPPEGLSFDAGTRTLSGTPDSVRTRAGYTYVVTDDALKTASLSFTIAVAPGPLRLPGAVSDQTYMVGTAIADLVLPEATGGTVPYSYTLTPDPPEGLSFDAGTRTLSGTPDSVRSRDPYTYMVTDDALVTASLMFTMAVEPAQLRLPGVVSDQAYTVGTAIADLVLPEATGGTSPYTYTLVPAPPEGLSFDAGTRTLSGTPNAVTAAATYEYKVTDSDAGADSLLFTIAVAMPVPLSLSGPVSDQAYTVGVVIPDLALPEATGGTTPYAYALTPAPPVGLSFDAGTRTLSGTPNAVTAAAPYQYRVTDSDSAVDSLWFTIAVEQGPVSREERDELPREVVVHGNYPNPFVGSTEFVFDLQFPADVTVTVMNVLGRTVLQTRPARLIGGKGHRLAISGAELPAGAYAYRFVARSEHAEYVHVGIMVRVK